jgi:hypothetical protein
VQKKALFGALKGVFLGVFTYLDNIETLSVSFYMDKTWLKVAWLLYLDWFYVVYFLHGVLIDRLCFVC